MPLRQRTPFRGLTKTSAKDYTSEPLPLVGVDTVSGNLWIEGYVKSVEEAQQICKDKERVNRQYFIMENDSILYEVE